MLNLIRTYDDALSPQLRAQLLDLPRELPATRTVLGDTGFDEWLVPEHLHAPLLAVQQDLTQRYVDDCGVQPEQWPAEYGYEGFRLKRYRPDTDDHFPPHVDVANHDTARRFLAFLFYVEGPIRGGETRFHDTGRDELLDICPYDGRCVVFPPLWPWLHVGTPCTGGKTILSGYWHYL
jgi:hypothetical protein